MDGGIIPVIAPLGKRQRSVQGHSQIHTKLEASLGYLRLSQNKAKHNTII